MKKLLTLIIALIIITGTASAAIYPDAMYVISLDRDADIVYVMDAVGNIFSFEGCEDWMLGDLVALIMDDNGTEYIDDDVILMTQYAGYLPEGLPLM